MTETRSNCEILGCEKPAKFWVQRDKANRIVCSAHLSRTVLSMRGADIHVGKTGPRYDSYGYTHQALVIVKVKRGNVWI